MSSEDEMERRLSEVGKRVNDSPGHGKKKPKTKASDTIPAGTGSALSLEAKAIIFEIFEKVKRGEIKLDSRLDSRSRKIKWGKKKSIEQTAHICSISAGKFTAPKERGGVPFTPRFDVAGFEKIRAVRVTLMEDFIKKMLPPSAGKIAAKIKEKNMCTEDGVLIKLSSKQTRRILAVCGFKFGSAGHHHVMKESDANKKYREVYCKRMKGNRDKNGLPIRPICFGDESFGKLCVDKHLYLTHSAAAAGSESAPHAPRHVVPPWPYAAPPLGSRPPH